MAKPVATLPQQLKVLTWWERDQPKAGAEEASWYVTTAEESGLSEKMVRSIIARDCATRLNELRKELRTEAQQIAHYVGATQQAALEVLAAGLHATEDTVIRNADGDPILDGNGDPLMQSRPLWPIQIQAAKLCLELHDSYTPKKVEVQMQVEEEITVNIQTLDLGALQERHAIAARNYARLIAGTVPAEDGGGTGGTDDGTDGPQSDDGHLVLAHADDQNKG